MCDPWIVFFFDSECILCSTDKAEGGRVSSEFDEASQRLQDYSECLGIEVNERINILDMLKDCQDYHSHCLSEVQKTASVSYEKIMLDTCTFMFHTQAQIIVWVIIIDYIGGV